MCQYKKMKDFTSASEKSNSPPHPIMVNPSNIPGEKQIKYSTLMPALILQQNGSSLFIFILHTVKHDHKM